MRNGRYSQSLSNPIEDKSQSFLTGRILLYMDRLLTRNPKLDYETLEFLYWLLGPEIVEQDLLPLAIMLDGGSRRGRFDREVEEIRNGRDFAHTVDTAVHRASRDDYHSVVDLIRDLVRKRLSQVQHASRKSDIEKNLTVFQQMFDLNELETEICMFLFIAAVFEKAQNYFQYHLQCHCFEGRNYLSIILGARGSEITRALNGKLSAIGILEQGRHRSLSMDSGFVDLLENASDAGLKTEFFKKIDPDPIPLDAHAVDPQVIEHILNLLKNKSQSSSHIIFYGPPGTGKTSLAYGIGKALDLPIYLVEHGGKDKTWKRGAALTACVNMASQGEGALIIADDADNILGTTNSWFLFGAQSDKRWLHDILETPGVRMIWTVNSVAALEESVARRFSYSLCFKPFNRGQRNRIWNTVLGDHRLDSFFAPADINDLTNRFNVSAGIIEQAVRKASEMGFDSKDEIRTAIIQSLDAHQKLVNGGHKPSRHRNINFDNFELEALNVSGVNLPDLLRELKEFDRYLRTSDSNEAVSMSLLFFGVPGSGKSHLARFIAYHMGREVIFKSAADLLSKWVGETEQNIRDAFEEAESKDNAVLVIDEIDSLIGSRDRATRSWEVSQVNQMLTSIEAYRGIQIYTSNRITDLDPAAIRRFNHKIEFGFLKREGAVILYKKILMPLVGSDFDKKLEDELKEIKALTPGDFKVVLTKHRFKDRNKNSHRALIAALKEEVRIKQVHSGQKAVGF
jgi:transitional endoplasmic reticulum ATPase